MNIIVPHFCLLFSLLKMLEKKVLSQSIITFIFICIFKVLSIKVEQNYTPTSSLRFLLWVSNFFFHILFKNICFLLSHLRVGNHFPSLLTKLGSLATTCASEEVPACLWETDFNHACLQMSSFIMVFPDILAIPAILVLQKVTSYFTLLCGVGLNHCHISNIGGIWRLDIQWES